MAEDGPEGQDGPMTVEVAYARPDRQLILPLEVAPGTTVDQALRQSEIDRHFPEIDLDNAKVGIFGKITRRDTVLRPRDRIEVYRPLIADPKEVRRQRAGQKGAGKKDAGKTDSEKKGPAKGGNDAGGAESAQPSGSTG
ncbi:RnfH family protein [Thioalkalivibrio sp. ALJ24]|uniref:RnfH family protein n=1 Tax=Thioalkalivibrio sp. ALJ24 TaxID=545276 RepID=UPI00037799EF|nr:RnfH family protein [Thioalkalivibrio sp. ALJ24]